MSLAKRLAKIEANQAALSVFVKALNEWKATIEGALLAEDEQEEQPILTLDGEDAGGERNQDEPL